VSIPVPTAEADPQPVNLGISSSCSSRRRLRELTFSDPPDGHRGSVLHMPPALLVLRHAVPVVVESVIAPLAVYYALYLIAGFRGALVAALAWSYVLVIRRLVRHERVSTLLLIGTALLTGRTVVSFVTGSAFVYFILPTASAFLASAVLFGSGLAGRPFTQRFTHDFCPLSPELLARPIVHRFFVHVSFLWGLAMFLNGAVVLCLLITTPTGAFPMERTGVSLSLTASAILVSVMWFARSMRRDGITVHFHHQFPLAAGSVSAG
jgi:hypothetical protein